MFLPKREFGFVTLPLILSVLLIAGLTVYSAVEYKRQNAPLASPLPSASPIESPLPTPASPAPSLTPQSITPSPTLSPKPSTPAVTTTPGSGYGYITVNTPVGAFPIHIITLNNPRMATDTANEDDCTSDCPTLPLSDFISRNGGLAGIHGSYFCPADYPECAGKKNSFDFSVYNSRLNKWINQGQLSWGNRSMVYQDGSGFHYLQNANSFNGSLSAGIVNYPGILNNGNIQVEEGNLSDKQRLKGTKGGIGLKGTGIIYIVVAPNVTMHEFAQVFKAIGADSALNLDGGGSIALFYGGYKAGPGRSLPNAVVFK